MLPPRRRQVYAELAGFASVNNAYHMTDTCAGWISLTRCISLVARRCLLRSRRDRSRRRSWQFDAPERHQRDRGNQVRVRRTGAKRIPVNSLKSMTGHALAASNAIEAVALCLEIHNSLIHPTINYRRPDERCDLDYIPNVARPARIGAALKLSSGFSGIHSVVVLRAVTK